MYIIIANCFKKGIPKYQIKKYPKSNGISSHTNTQCITFSASIKKMSHFCVINSLHKYANRAETGKRERELIEA